MIFPKKPEWRSRLAITMVVGLVILMANQVSRTFAQGTSLNSTALYRVTLIVSDIGQSMNFYQRLGLVLQSDVSRASGDEGGIISGETLPLTDDPTRSRLVVMAGEDHLSGAIGLLWYDRPPLPSARGNLMGTGTGDIVLMFAVTDIQWVYSRLGATSTRFHSPPIRFTERDSGGNLKSGLKLLAYDPDGHMVEIIQLD